MKLRSYQLCRWCDALWHDKRKWFCLGAGLLLLLLMQLLGLQSLLLPLMVLCAALLAVYALNHRKSFGECYQRPPRPRDASCETIQIDADLIGQGTRLRAAAQPIDPAESLSIRLGSGALLLGTAMTLTADALESADRAAVLSAVQGLNIKPDRMRSQYPVLRRENLGDVTMLTVRDGLSQRRFYMGPTGDVADLCAAIWEGHTRPMESYDHLRIADSAAYITQGKCRVLAFATALEGEEPIFLGLCGLGEEIDLTAVADISSLRAMGLTVLLTPGDSAQDLTSMLALLDLPDFHAKADVRLTPHLQAEENALCITRKPGDSLLEPVHTLRMRFRQLEATLRRLALYLGIPMGLCILYGSWPASLCAGAMLLFAALALGVDEHAPRLSKGTLIGLCALFLLAKVILLTQPAPLARMAGGIIVMVMAMGCGIRLCGSHFRWEGLCLVLPALAALYALFSLIFALPLGTALLLPLGFAGLIGAVGCLVVGR